MERDQQRPSTLIKNNHKITVYVELLGGNKEDFKEGKKWACPTHGVQGVKGGNHQKCSISMLFCFFSQPVSELFILFFLIVFYHLALLLIGPAPGGPG